MKINTKNRRHTINTTSAGLSVKFVLPVAGSHRATSLTIGTGNRSLDLNGRQVRALREVFAKTTNLTRLSTKASSNKK